MPEMNKKTKELIYSIGLIFIPIAFLFVAIIAAKPEKITTQSDEIVLETIIENKKTFANINIEAKSAIVKDLNTGEILFEKNSDVPLPLASITKIMTAITFEKFSDKEILEISFNDLNEYGDNLLFAGEKFYKKDLLDFTLITSSNDAAAALASNAFNIYNPTTNSNDSRQFFVDQMNETAREIGMTKSYFLNPTGLDNGVNVAGAHGSAKDVATMIEYALKKYPELLESTKNSSIKIRSIDGAVHSATNTNEVIDSLPNIVASKTGFTDIAGGNLAVVIDPGLNRPVIIVVLGSSEKGRFSDVSNLADKTIEYFQS